MRRLGNGAEVARLESTARTVRKLSPAYVPEFSWSKQKTPIFTCSITTADVTSRLCRHAIIIVHSGQVFALFLLLSSSPTPTCPPCFAPDLNFNPYHYIGNQHTKAAKIPDCAPAPSIVLRACASFGLRNILSDVSNVIIATSGIPTRLITMPVSSVLGMGSSSGSGDIIPHLLMHESLLVDKLWSESNGIKNTSYQTDAFMLILTWQYFSHGSL